MENINNTPTSKKENKPDSLLKQRTNIFLINYFDYLALALALAVFTVGLFWFIYPQYQSISKSNKMAMENLQTEYAAKSAYLNAINALKQSYRRISEADKNKIAEMVPVEKNIVAQIPKIESIVISNSAILNSIKIEPVDFPGQAGVKVDSGETSELPAGIFNGPLPAGVKLVKIEIDLGLVNYQVLKNIIKTFENNLRLYDIADINYLASDNEASLVIYSYYLSS